MSSGHFYETTKWANDKARYALSLAILQLSRGWQMRDAFQVRRDELSDAFRRRTTQAPVGLRRSPVFTLAPNARRAKWHGDETFTPPSDLPPDVSFGVEALVGAVATIDVMLDAKPMEPGPEGVWTTQNQAFSDGLATTSLDSQQKRRLIDAFFLRDLGHEIRRSPWLRV
jgi:hypothetical protein